MTGRWDGKTVLGLVALVVLLLGLLALPIWMIGSRMASPAPKFIAIEPTAGTSPPGPAASATVPRRVAGRWQPVNVTAAAVPWRSMQSMDPSPSLATATVSWRSTGQMPLSKPKPIATATVPWRPQGRYQSVTLATAAVAAFPVPTPLEIQRHRQEMADAGRPLDQIRLVSGFEGATSLKISRLSNTHFAIDFEGKFCNWFMFRVEGAAGKTLRIDLRNVSLEKWGSLNPVCSYVESLDDPDSFVTQAVAEPHEPVAAYNGPLIPDTRGQQWHYMREVWADRRYKACAWCTVSRPTTRTSQ